MKFIHFALFSLLLLPVMSARAGTPSVAYIQRTLSKLEASTTEHPAHVRVLFYGQSVTRSAWTEIVARQLRERYPTAVFEFRNAAIGGYTSQVLVRTAEHDLYPWYPDVLFFHVWGPMDAYEAIVRRTRARTTAEIVLWTSHYHAFHDPDDPNAGAESRADAIRAIARRYDCMLIDLREKWRRHLQKNRLTAGDLLRDSVHLNEAGIDLYARFIGEALLRVPALGDNPSAAGTLRILHPGDEGFQVEADGSLSLTFSGNRVVVVSDGGGDPARTARVLLDGQPMDDVRERWAFSRPSNGPGFGMPAINQITFRQPLLEEDWTLTCLPGSHPDGSRIHYRVVGSRTGDDGEGWSTDPFISRSGRVAIDREDGPYSAWRLRWMLERRQAELPEGFQVTWTAYPLFVGEYRPQPAGTRTAVIQAGPAGTHTLSLVPDTDGRLGIESVVVHQPPPIYE